MSAKTLTLAKSLHTVSVLVAVARHVMDPGRADGLTLDPAYAVGRAMDILGYDSADMSDPYGLQARAIAALRKESAASAAPALPDAVTLALADMLAMLARVDAGSGSASWTAQEHTALCRSLGAACGQPTDAIEATAARQGAALRKRQARQGG